MGLISRSPEQLGQTEREARGSICSRMGSSIPGITATISPICLNDGGLLRIVPYKRGYRTNAFGRFHLSGYATYQDLRRESLNREVSRAGTVERNRELALADSEPF